VKTVRWDPEALRDMRRLDPQVARQIRDGVGRYARTEHGDVKKLSAPEFGFRLRAGDWRVRFLPQHPDTIIVFRVRHRSEAYR
jgi:mRNA-degrading endonuclease RelE of RelBE toxin-antitoxin system